MSISTFSERSLLRWPRRDDVSEAANGNRTAFDNLVVKHSAELRSFLRNKVRPEALDDLLQEVWLATWESLPKFDYRGAFRTWLYGIAMNKVRDHWRRRARQEHEVPIFDLAAFPAVEDDYLATDSNEAVRSLLGSLSLDQREVLDLYYRADLNLPEVARVLNRNLNTVKYQFYRAHEKLAGQLKPEDLR